MDSKVTGSEHRMRRPDYPLHLLPCSLAVLGTIVAVWVLGGNHPRFGGLWNRVDCPRHKEAETSAPASPALGPILWAPLFTGADLPTGKRLANPA
jgi:hypothetical protein